MSATIPVVILAGGLGTRLRQETEHRPKPMVPVGHQPILWHIMKTYAHHGHHDFVLCLGYKGEVIRDYFIKYAGNTGDVRLDLGAGTQSHLGNTFEKVDWRVLLADTGEHTMTGGRIRRVRDYVAGADRFMMTYGDGVADIDIPALLETHRRAGTVATVTGVNPTSRYGELKIDGDRVVAFAEKEPFQDVWISGGYFVFDQRIFDYLTGDDTILEQAPLRRLAETGQLSVHRHRGYWQSMDTYREFELLNRLWKEGNAPWKVW